MVLEEDVGEGNFRHDELWGEGGSEGKGGGEAAEEVTEDEKVRAALDLLLSLLKDPSLTLRQHLEETDKRREQH